MASKVSATVSNSKTAKKATTTTTTTNNTKTVMKPLDPNDFDSNKVDFSAIKTNPTYGNKSVYTKYLQDNTDGKFRVVARNCKIITSVKEVKPFEDKKANASAKKPEPKPVKHQLFISITDESFIKMVDELEEVIINKSVAWYDDFDVKDCATIFKKTLLNNKFGYAIGTDLSTDCKCIDKTDGAKNDVSIEELTKGKIIDVCFNFDRIKLGSAEFKISPEISQCHIKGVSAAFEYKSITPSVYVPDKITLTDKETKDFGGGIVGKFCKFMVDGVPFRLNLKNVSGRLIKKIDEESGKESFNLCVNITDSETKQMLTNVYENIQKLLVANSKTYYDGKKMNERTIKLKPLFNYGPKDLEKIKKGESPQYSQSMWLKVYHSEEKGFDGKIKDVESKQNLSQDEVANKPLNIENLVLFSKHIWFDKTKGTSINLSLNLCEISTDVPSYNMDDDDDKVDDDKEESDADNQEQNDGATGNDTNVADEDNESEPENSDTE